MPTLSQLSKTVGRMKDETRWQAESDARALVQANEVKSDKNRLARAKLVADLAAAVAAQKATAVANMK